jgi:hypothetical protein
MSMKARAERRNRGRSLDKQFRIDVARESLVARLRAAANYSEAWALAQHYAEKYGVPLDDDLRACVMAAISEVAGTQFLEASPAAKVAGLRKKKSGSYYYDAHKYEFERV